MKKLGLLLSLLIFFGSAGFSQQNQSNSNDDETKESKKKLQYFRQPGYQGLNVFETPKETGVEYDGFDVRIGGDFALQFQGLDHSNADGAPELAPLGSDINLPTANLNLDVQLLEGMRMHLRTYLSSRHHNETWVKGGYLQVDKLNFISDDFAAGIMDITTLRAGVDEPNYGDAHFRRTDNAMAIYNPFVGNYIMDAFTTEPFIEAYFQPNDFIIGAGMTNGYLNPTASKANTQFGTGEYLGESDIAPTFYGKLGWDSQVNDMLRVRLTGSFYSAQGADNGDHLYNGDRAGSRYYNVFDYIAADSTVSSNDFSGRFNPGFSKETALQFNPFIKYGNVEFFGVFEQTTGNNGADDREDGKYTQLGAELLYRFGSWSQFYIGGRYNSVSGHDDYAEGETKPDEKTVNRLNIGGGWFITENTLVKLEYVNQQYDDNFRGTFADPQAPTNLTEGQFSGVVMEAVIAF
ncbi:MAG: hypothetical protein ACLFNL_04700 [Bacteroidales bacterium]